MAIFLRIEHIDGLRMRQQTAQKVQREGTDGTVKAGTEWRFDKDPVSKEDALVQRDLDSRTREPTNIYSPVLNFGLRNLVIERKGPVVAIAFRNSSVRNQLRIRYEQFLPTGKKNSKDEDILEWRSTAAPTYILPSQWGGVSVGTGIRAFLDEMPT